ncbi:hypothetical protein [Aquicoccus porphyridii]|uniref:Uncharacterized protein n=1 Tax=Aquicoccus porphyridii TaxID=1852029 RepID=A0A5A9YX40_9RHOB|nr:hypothetical protein [Aquicoccus porphyridii]KAA0909458.1 hypothetical protein FLO80_21495 [Aquicoccus porphyridii]
MPGNERNRTPLNQSARILDAGSDNNNEPTVRTLWVPHAIDAGTSDRNSCDIGTSDVLQLSNGTVLFQGIRELIVKERPEFPALSNPVELHVLASVEFPQKFVSPPSIMLAFGPPQPVFTICAKQITCESFTIAMRSICADPTTVRVSWKAVGFSTFGNFSVA